jgi:two-component system, sensor histidine kinase and response regulator
MTLLKQLTSMPQAIPGFDLDEGLNRVGGDSQLYKQLLISFYKKNAHLQQELEKQIQQQNYSAATQLVHAVKGVSGNLSAKDLSAAAKQLELSLKQHPTPDLSSSIEQFSTALTVVLDALASITVDTQPPRHEKQENHPLNLQTITDAMKELSKLLDEFNMDAEESYQVLQQQLMQAEYKDTLISLENAINDLDFELAAKTLNELANTLKIKF